MPGRFGHGPARAESLSFRFALAWGPSRCLLAPLGLGSVACGLASGSASARSLSYSMQARFDTIRPPSASLSNGCWLVSFSAPVGAGFALFGCGPPRSDPASLHFDLDCCLCHFIFALVRFGLCHSRPWSGSIRIGIGSVRPRLASVSIPSRSGWKVFGSVSLRSRAERCRPRCLLCLVRLWQLMYHSASPSVEFSLGSLPVVLRFTPTGYGSKSLSERIRLGSLWLSFGSLSLLHGLGPVRLG